MTHHIDETQAVLISGTSVTAIEIIQGMGLERFVSFSIQSTIGLLTCAYLIIKIFNSLKRKEK